MKHKVLWLIGLSLLVIMTACGGANSSEGTVADRSAADKTVADNERDIPALYKQNCLSCHGDQLQGRVGPNLQTVGDKMNTEELFDLIHDGRKGMPGFGKRLSEEEITLIAAWLAEQK